MDEDEIAAAMLALAEQRGPAKTFCPSEVARGFGAEWQALMPRVRRVADKLAAEGRIVVLQKGEWVEAEAAQGPIRLGLPRRD